MNRTMAIMAVAALLAMNLGAQGRDEDEEARRGSENRGPTLGVARISVTDGDVRLIRASRDAVQAKAGMPLVLGDRFATGSRSRAEIQFDGGNFARLGADTEVRIGQLSTQTDDAGVYSMLVQSGVQLTLESDHGSATTGPLAAASTNEQNLGACGGPSVSPSCQSIIDAGSPAECKISLLKMEDPPNAKDNWRELWRRIALASPAFPPGGKRVMTNDPDEPLGHLPLNQKFDFLLTDQDAARQLPPGRRI